MNTGQKKLLLWSLVVGAVVAHGVFCEWRLQPPKEPPKKMPWEQTYIPEDERLAAAKQEQELLSSAVLTIDKRGLYTDRRIGPKWLMVVLGIVIPLILLVLVRFLQLGWFPGATGRAVSKIFSKTWDVMNTPIGGNQDRP